MTLYGKIMLEHFQSILMWLMIYITKNSSIALRHKIIRGCGCSSSTIISRLQQKEQSQEKLRQVCNNQNAMKKATKISNNSPQTIKKKMKRENTHILMAPTLISYQNHKMKNLLSRLTHSSLLQTIKINNATSTVHGHTNKLVNHLKENSEIYQVWLS